MEKSKASERCEVLGDHGREEAVKRVINKIRRQNGMLFGQLLMYQVGKDTVFVVEDDSSEDFEVESLNTRNTDDGRRREVLESALYFAILDNHVVVQQSRSLKSRELEKHFNWLLRECTDMLPEEPGICLSDKPTEKARQTISKLHVKAVRVGTPLVAEQNAIKAKSSIQEEIKAHFVPMGRGFEAIKAYLGEMWPDNLGLKDALDDANLEVMIQVSCKNRTTDSGDEVLNQLARAFRHLEPEDAVIDTKDGSVLMGKELKLTGYVYADTYNGVVDYEDLYDQMYSWCEKQNQ